MTDDIKVKIHYDDEVNYDGHEHIWRPVSTWTDWGHDDGGHYECGVKEYMCIVCGIEANVDIPKDDVNEEKECTHLRKTNEGMASCLTLDDAAGDADRTQLWYGCTQCFATHYVVINTLTGDIILRKTMGKEEVDA